MTQHHQPLHILGVCVCVRGHATPMLHVLEACRKNGHDVTFCTEDFGVDDFELVAAKIGVKLVPIATGKTREQASREELESGVVGTLPVRERMLANTKKTVAAIGPDVVLCDFATVAGMEAATELGIPLVINVALALHLVRVFLGLPDPRPRYQLCGVHVRLSCFDSVKLGIFWNIIGLGDFSSLLRLNACKAKILVHSFFGLEEPMELPPQIRMIGPALPSMGERAVCFQKKHSDLCCWLHAEGAAPTIMISTGTLNELHPWQVRELFHAVKEAGLRAAWSLKVEQQAHLPRAEDPSFWIAAWLPQSELLSDPAVVAVVTHCGWNTTLETICVGKPQICMPFWGDQPMAAQLVVAAGCGELISRLPRQSLRQQNTYVEGAFDAKSVAPILKRVVEEPRYQEAAKRMQRAALHSGGAAQAAQEIELSARYGNDHLCSEQIQRTWGGNPFGGALAVFVAAAAALILRWIRAHGFFRLGAIGAVAAGMSGLAAYADSAGRPGELMRRLIRIGILGTCLATVAVMILHRFRAKGSHRLGAST